jgi:response regulator of citrate/malate metabolism
MRERILRFLREHKGTFFTLREIANALDFPATEFGKYMSVVCREDDVEREVHSYRGEKPNYKYRAKE